MITVNTYNIKGYDDLELGIKRSAPLTYHIAYNTSKEPDGIIFSIPGFGKDSDINYQLNLIKHIAQTYNLVAICVEYHCFFSRIYTGASYDFNQFDKKIFLDIIKRYKIDLDPKQTNFTYMVDKLHDYVTIEKQKDPSFKNYRENIFATIQPKKNEYQNFGILQTIDILTVLYHLKSNGYEQLIRKKPLFAFGSSHGAYLANLLMKFAPNTFDAIIENSAYINPPLMYIVGQEYNTKQPETFSLYKDSILIHAFTLTHWTLDHSSPNYFNENAIEIRNLLNQNQLDQFLHYKSKTKVISYHSVKDNFAPYSDKKKYIETLKNNNKDIQFITINNENQIDGKLIKNIEHSMGMSNKELLKTHLPQILAECQNSTSTDICNHVTIKYTINNNSYYQFQFTENSLDIKIKKLI